MMRVAARGMVRMAIALAWLACVGADVARADVGQLVSRETVGDFTLTLLAEPVPLRAGPVRFSVLVQDAAGAPVDARVTLRVRGAGPHDAHAHAAAGTAPPGDAGVELRVAAGNALFREAMVQLPSAGDYRVDLLAQVAGRELDATTELSVGEPVGDLRRNWVYVALGPAGAGVLALHQWLCARRGASGRSRRS